MVRIPPGIFRDELGGCSADSREARDRSLYEAVGGRWMGATHSVHGAERGFGILIY